MHNLFQQRLFKRNSLILFTLYVLVLQLAFISKLTYAQESSVTFFTPEINSMIEADQELIKKRGYGNLVIPRELHNIRTEQCMTPNSIEVAKRLNDAGFTAYVVGGCVRDFVMEKPANDIDLVTNATMEQLEELFGDSYVRHSNGYNEYGYVKFSDEIVDTNHYSSIPKTYLDHDRLLESISSSLIKDSFERDFSMNAIYFNPFTEELIDYQGGLADIRDKKLRYIFDPLLNMQSSVYVIIRAMRFMAKYGFELPSDAEKVFQEKAVSMLASMPKNVTIYFNTMKLFKEGNAEASYRVLKYYKAIGTIFPPLQDVVETPEGEKMLENVMRELDSEYNIRKSTNQPSMSTSYVCAKILAVGMPDMLKKCNDDYEVAIDKIIQSQLTFFIGVNGEEIKEFLLKEVTTSTSEGSLQYQFRSAI